MKLVCFIIVEHWSLIVDSSFSNLFQNWNDLLRWLYLLWRRRKFCQSFYIGSFLTWGQTRSKYGGVWCNANIHSYLGYFSVNFIWFYYVCVLIWLWKCYLYSLWLIVCFLHVFRLKMCMERTSDFLEWSVELVKSNWSLWEEYRVITIGAKS